MCFLQDSKTPRVKAACKKPAAAHAGPPTKKRKTAGADPDPVTPSPGGRPAAEPKSGPKQSPAVRRQGRGRRPSLDLKEKQAAEDERKAERLQKAQVKADEMAKLIRSSGILDLQPPRGFTNKLLAII